MSYDLHMHSIPNIEALYLKYKDNEWFNIEDMKNSKDITMNYLGEFWEAIKKDLDN